MVFPPKEGHKLEEVPPSEHTNLRTLNLPWDTPPMNQTGFSSFGGPISSWPPESASKLRLFFVVVFPPRLELRRPGHFAADVDKVGPTFWVLLFGPIERYGRSSYYVYIYTVYLYIYTVYNIYIYTYTQSRYIITDMGLSRNGDLHKKSHPHCGRI